MKKYKIIIDVKEALIPLTSTLKELLQNKAEYNELIELFHNIISMFQNHELEMSCQEQVAEKLL